MKATPQSQGIQHVSRAARIAARPQMDMAVHGEQHEGDNKPDAGTTTFLNEVSTNEVEHVSPTMLDEAYHKTGSTGYVQGLKEFLAKPVAVRQFQMGTNSGQKLADLRLDRTIFEDNPVWADKIKGFMGIRGTWVVRLQVNATPFQQGRLLMVFEPMKQYYTYWDRLEDLTRATQLPRVELDIATESQAIMTIPYINLQSHLDLMNNTGAWGDVNVLEYLPFRTGSSSDSADCTLWVSLEDVELVAPTVPWTGSAKPQMSFSGYGLGPILEKVVEATESVRFFDAKGDGSTDDTDALQNAFDSTDHLHIPAGVYRVTGPIRVSKSSMYVWGDGPGSTIIQRDSDTSDFDIISWDDSNTVDAFTIRDLTIDGADQNGSLLTCDGSTNQHKNMVVSNCVFKNFLADAHGVHPKGIDGVQIDRCLFESGGSGSFYHGVYTRRVNNVKITNCTFIDVGGQAIKHTEGSQGAVLGNSFTTPERSIQRVINLSDFSQWTVSGNSINCDCETFIRLGSEGGSSPKQAIVSNNNLTGSISTGGIDCNTGRDFVVTSNNYYVTGENNATYGIRFRGVTDGVASSNLLRHRIDKDVTYTFILVAEGVGDPAYITIVNNVFETSGPDGTFIGVDPDVYDDDVVALNNVGRGGNNFSIGYVSGGAEAYTKSIYLDSSSGTGSFGEVEFELDGGWLVRKDSKGFAPVVTLTPVSTSADGIYNQVVRQNSDNNNHDFALYDQDGNLYDGPIRVHITVPKQARGDAATPQMSMRSGRRNPTTQETGASQVGPISSLLNRASGIATVAAGIPELSAFAGPTAWASGLAARVAGAFGWSKPLNTSEIARVNRSKNQYQSNVEGVENAYNLGLLSRAQVRALPGFAGTDVDEMSIDFVKRVPAYVTKFEFSSLSDPNLPLFQLPLRPRQMYALPDPITSDNDAPPEDEPFSLSPVSFLGYLFKYYRGGFIIKFKMCKTQFHSGRIAVSFTPAYLNAIDGDRIEPKFEDSVFLHRDIIDLREGSEFEFHVPFVSLLPYLETSESFGQLQVWVVHDLKHPETTADTVDVAVEVCAAPDFEVAVPVNPQYLPAKPQMSMGNTITTLGAAKADEYNSATQGQSTIWSEMCIGEKISSLKQLMHRSVQIKRDDYLDDPFKIEVGAGADYYSIIGACYAFGRGGVIYRAFRNSPGELTWTLDTDSDRDGKRRFEPIVTEVENQFASVYVPQYMQVHGRLNYHAGGTFSTGRTRRYYPSLRLNLQGTPDYTFRSAAEDTQFGYFLGVPPLERVDVS